MIIAFREAMAARSGCEVFKDRDEALQWLDVAPFD